jgi:hypothetical protein
MLQCTVEKHKTNLHHVLFPTLGAYRTVVKTTIGFTLFHLFHDIKFVLPIGCKIPALCTVIELFPNTSSLEQRLFSLELVNEDRRESLQNKEVAKKRTKSTFERQVNLQSFTEGNLVLAYDISHNKLSHSKFESLCHLSLPY